jgi:hypothetical protein
MPIEELLAHAQKDNNRSRAVCVKLGWMNADGSMNEIYLNNKINELMQPASTPSPTA